MIKVFHSLSADFLPKYTQKRQYIHIFVDILFPFQNPFPQVVDNFWFHRRRFPHFPPFSSCIHNISGCTTVELPTACWKPLGKTGGNHHTGKFSTPLFHRLWEVFHQIFSTWPFLPIFAPINPAAYQICYFSQGTPAHTLVFSTESSRIFSCLFDFSLAIFQVLWYTICMIMDVYIVEYDGEWA